MTVNAKPRAGGKTYDIIHHSAQTGSPILCASRSEVRRIQAVAKDLMVSIPTPIFIDDCEGKGTSGYCVDNAELMLKKLIKEKYGVDVSYITVSTGYSLSQNPYLVDAL